ncbi:hypothetical protein [Candidatus Binatus sp.]|uniref:hypothetical protein n=1 Tax=Candidatus Binatus sp. TaxID=2811406 RepID=UPI002F926ABE
MSGGELDTGRLLDGSDPSGAACGVGGAPPMMIDGADSGMAAAGIAVLDDALVS